jgi:hypothetical protein
MYLYRASEVWRIVGAMAQDRDDAPTLPPSDAELESLATFELLIRAFGESDARYVHTSLRLDSLLAHQPVE